MEHVRYPLAAMLLPTLICVALAGCPPLPEDIGVVLRASPEVLDFDTAQTVLILEVSKNATSRPMPAMAVSSPEPWISIESCQRVDENCVSTGPSDKIGVPIRIDRDKMAPGANTGSILIQAAGVATQTVDVVAINLAAADFAVDNRTPEVGESIQFTNQSVVLAEAEPVTGLVWNFGDGNTASNESNPKHTYTQAGTYTVSLALTTEIQSAKCVRPHYIDVSGAPPTADFACYPTGLFEDESVAFTNLSTPGGGDIADCDWLWLFGDGKTSSKQNPTHSYTRAGMYTVSLTAGNMYGSDTMTKPNAIVVQPKVGPTANFRVTTQEPLVNSPVQFENLSEPGTSPITLYAWDFGDGAVSDQANPQHIYTESGTYTVSLTVETAHGADTMTGVEVTPGVLAPAADFTADMERALTIDSVQFTDCSFAGTAPIHTWAWNFGDPASGAQDVSDEPNPTHTYASLGTYTVTLAVTTAIGSDQMAKTDYIDVFEPTALDSYVRMPDEAYRYAAKKSTAEPGFTAHFLQMTSQSWPPHSQEDRRDWLHWLTVVEPDTVASDTALLFISGGSSSSGMPDVADDELGALIGLACESGTVVAMLKQVPNQPLTFADEDFSRTEDEIIAYSLAKYSETRDPTWPALLPMTKSAVRAMDTIVDFLAREVAPDQRQTIEHFVVSGASKRGWTTWLTAAVDPRVVAIAPLVIDVLNMNEQMRHQYEVYGYFSEAVYDYVEMGIFQKPTPENNWQVVDEEGRKIIDPYEFRERLKMPKLLINSSGDEFFLPDSAQFYFQDLPGEKYLTYLPNTNHGLGGYEKVIKTLLPWYRAQLASVERPNFSWTIVENEGRMIIEADEEPLEVNLWTALSENRDFRMDIGLNPAAPAWASEPVSASGVNCYGAQAPWPDHGWGAFFVELKFASPFSDGDMANPYTFTSEIRVIPDTVPEHVAGPLPVADFSALPLQPSLNEDVMFTDASVSGARPIIRWHWDFGDGGARRDQHPTHPYTTLDTFDVALTVYTVLGSDTKVERGYITIQGASIPPTADFSALPTMGYAPLDVQFTDESTCSTAAITSWLWEFGDETTSDEQNPMHTYTDPGIYTVSLTVTTESGLDATERAEDYIQVNAAAIADFSFDTATPATFEPVQFSDQSVGIGAPIQSWLWDFGDGITSNDPSPVHAYTALSTYTVALTVATEYGSDTIVKPECITVYTSSPSPLEEYVAAADGNYGWSPYGTPQQVSGPYGDFTVHILDVTSQKWRTEEEVDKPLWRHWVTIVEPDVVTNDTAWLFVNGGSNTSGPPDIDGFLFAIAAATKSVVVDLHGVPSEPLRFTDETRTRTEDEIIAYTYDKFMNSVAAGAPDPTWPLLLPMAKSAVKAMDAVQEYLLDLYGREVVNYFVVAGGSKRGWTTWLTAVADPERVVAIIPMVIDVLNIETQMAHHRAAYSYWAPSIYDYAQMRVFERLGTPEADALMNIVDPYRRRDRLTMPKFIVNSTGDQFFLCDSSQFYFDDLPGEKYLSYIPNTDHGLNTEESTIRSLLAFFASVVNDQPRPQFSWDLEGDNAIRVHTVTAPQEVYLWQAHADTAVTKGRRDFRLETIGASWEKSVLTETAYGSGEYLVQVSVPDVGWTAFLVQLLFEGGYIFTTQVRVVPDTYPLFESYRTSVGEGSDAIPVYVLYGTPYEMGADLGTLMETEVQEYAPQFLEMAQGAEPVLLSNENLDAAWEATSPHMDQRFKAELQGLADGSGVNEVLLKRVHMVPVLESYSCSSVAAWNGATANHHLFQTRNLDWSLEAGAHEYPCLAMYIPDEGMPHVNVAFAGFIGSHAGMNLGGIALASMGDSPGGDRPYDLDGNHFAPMFREILYDALSLTQAIDIIYETPRIKKYHYVIGDGRNELAAVKIRAHEPKPLEIWTDDDPDDPNAVANGGDGVFIDVVYNDEGRGAWRPIYDNYGYLDENTMIDIANSIPIKGSNVVNVVYDATDVRLWVSYARGALEAYQRPYVEFNMQDYLP